MKKREEIKNHFIYFGFVYVLIALFSIAGFRVLTLWKCQAKSYEKVSAFVGLSSFDSELASAEIQKNDDESLLEVDLTSYSPKESYFGTALTAAMSSGTTDFVIVAPSQISATQVQSYCLPLKQLDFGSDIPALGEETIDGVAYGYRIRDGEKKYWPGFIDYSVDDAAVYCLYFIRSSVNFSGVFKDAATQKSAHAAQAIRTLFSYGGNA